MKCSVKIISDEIISSARDTTSDTQMKHTAGMGHEVTLAAFIRALKNVGT